MKSESPIKIEEGEPEASPAENSSSAGKKILIVEDNDSLRRIYFLTFRAKYAEYKLREACSGKEAIEIAKSFKPDVLLIDLGLPDMSGRQVAKTCREQPELKGAKYIAVSGRDEDEEIQLSKEAGFCHQFIKPLDFDSLKDWL